MEKAIILKNNTKIEKGKSLSLIINNEKIQNVIIMDIKETKNDTIVKATSVFFGTKEYTINELEKIAFANETIAKKYLEKNRVAIA